MIFSNNFINFCRMNLKKGNCSSLMKIWKEYIVFINSGDGKNRLIVFAQKCWEDFQTSELASFMAPVDFCISDHKIIYILDNMGTDDDAEWYSLVMYKFDGTYLASLDLSFDCGTTAIDFIPHLNCIALLSESPPEIVFLPANVPEKRVTISENEKQSFKVALKDEAVGCVAWQDRLFILEKKPPLISVSICRHHLK